MLDEALFGRKDGTTQLAAVAVNGWIIISYPALLNNLKEKL